MSETDTIEWSKGDDGIVVLTLNEPGRSANTLTHAHIDSVDRALSRLRDELDSVTGVIITSAKKTFFAGGDLNDIRTYTHERAAEIDAYLTRIKKQFRTLETLGKPVVAAIGGAALGGGLEIALATHHRIIADVRGAVVGFPEVNLGLLPAIGGVTRSVRLLGLTTALDRLLLPGTPLAPTVAKQLGLIDEVVGSADELLPAARAWILANPDAAVQPWDQPGYRIPGGVPGDRGLAPTLQGLSATLRAKLKGAPYPAPRALLATAVEGAAVDFDTATSIENRYFISLATGVVAKNLIAATFFDPQTVNAGANRPDGFERQPPKRVGVLGAGMMGAGVAFVTARSGIDVVLKDVSAEAVEKGKDFSRTLVARLIERGKLSEQQGAELLERITTTTDPAGLADVDFVVEAVFESLDLKKQVLREIEPFVTDDAVLGSNTSTLPITELAQGVDRTDDGIGVHFFSPVDRMPLLEIIVGESTSDRALARAFDFARAIGKTPIVVNDNRGFFTSRTIIAFLNEAVAAIGEGVQATSIEQAGLQDGYPAGPLQLIDELTLTLPRKARDEAKTAAHQRGTPWSGHPADEVIDRLIDEFERPGRSGGAGFYEYDEKGKRSRLWPGLAEAFGSRPDVVPFEDLKERLLFAESLEAVRALDEGVLRSVTDGNVGSILGIGFPSWTGGVFRYIDSYSGGLAGFMVRADELADRYGERFRPPTSLRDRAQHSERYSS